MLETPQINITVMSMGTPDREYIGLSKPQAKAIYTKLSSSLFCYPAVSVDGQQLNTAKARKFFGMKKLIGEPQRRQA